jgi:CO/xanthine dehydrogenase FAD-binding subunit
MNLNTITEVKRPKSLDEIPEWHAGYAWLAGGTWLYSTPQIETNTLIDLETLGWPALKADADGLEIAATCTIAELERFAAPAGWTAAPLLRLCCHALLICMSLPAGAMISLTAALEGTYTLWPRGEGERKISALDFVTGNHENVLQPGELLRSIRLPATALTKRYAFRRSSLTHLGRSAALVIGTSNAGKRDLTLTITASTNRPIQLKFDRMPNSNDLGQAIETRVADAEWFGDVHGSARYKRHLTYYYAMQIREELAAR